MEYTKGNCKVAKRIYDILAESGCTITQAVSILSYVEQVIRTTVKIPAYNNAAREMMRHKELSASDISDS